MREVLPPWLSKQVPESTGSTAALCWKELAGFKQARKHNQQQNCCFVALLTSESDQSVVGSVTSLQVQEAWGEVVRVTWVGVQGATSYRVSWRKTDGDGSIY